MKKLTLMITLLSTSLFVNAQSDDFEEGMKKGYDMFNDGDHHDAWINGAESLATLSKKHPNEWLSYYWAAYMYTQIARNSSKNPPKGITSEKMLDNAQKYLDLASERIKDKSPEQEVDFHMLQKLTYDFRGDKEKFKKLAEAELKAAIRKDSNHPTVLVSLGLDLFFGAGDDDYRSVNGSRVLLLQAKGQFDSRVKPRYMSTHYAEQWVNYWEPQTKKKLVELIGK